VDTQEKSRNVRAVEVLRRLDEVGAIKLDVLISKASEINDIVRGGSGGSAALDEEDRICYPFMIRIGPRHDLDLVSVASELRQLGFEVKRLAPQAPKKG
jgi:hypothetical protein